MEDRWLSVDEIGDYIGNKRDAVYKRISEKRMPDHKAGRLWKFKKDEVDTLLRDGKTTILKRVKISEAVCGNT